LHQGVTLMATTIKVQVANVMKLSTESPQSIFPNPEIMAEKFEGWGLRVLSPDCFRSLPPIL